MAKRPRSKKDIWFHGRWWSGYMPVSIEGLILVLVVGPIGALLIVSPDWLAKHRFDPWVGALSFSSGVVIMLVCVVLYLTHRGFDPDL